MGRLCFCGFEIVGEGESGGKNYVVVKKVKEPSTDAHPSYSLIVRLPRVGKDNKIINVYKIRTMYAYSEYMQDYIYKQHNLKKGGKIADDYRISAWGKMMRKCWLDEVPMILNVLKGELKLMGVRPLSRQYFELYTPEMQALHVSVKPGLIPPYYADLPETLEEIQESERRYIEQYKAHPFRTNWKYFWRIFKNIFVKQKHSC